MVCRTMTEHRRADLERLHHVSNTQVDARDPWGLAGVPKRANS